METKVKLTKRQKEIIKERNVMVNFLKVFHPAVLHGHIKLTKNPCNMSWEGLSEMVKEVTNRW